ncbi:hypothetical protein [Planobispora takensis]|nr:hypothetical protein [Planobispora takensis]
MNRIAAAPAGAAVTMAGASMAALSIAARPIFRAIFTFRLLTFFGIRDV